MSRRHFSSTKEHGWELKVAWMSNSYRKIRDKGRNDQRQATGSHINRNYRSQDLTQHFSKSEWDCDTWAVPCLNRSGRKKCRTQVLSQDLAPPSSLHQWLRANRGLNEKQAGHKETDYGLHPAAYFICFDFKVLIEPDVEKKYFFVIYFNINIINIIWKL